ncbi:ABC transporter permease [Cupriavidus sp. USMAA2-4]|uniref:ABC transporter permease n=1 Tax=Cupriavidus sp. USMAA2-4 TaxID=876364 RepID=UPI0009FBA1A9|nr:ABC transporter permease [Cupriavidus sp. USMAA2-4]
MAKPIPVPAGAATIAVAGTAPAPLPAAAARSGALRIFLRNPAGVAGLLVLLALGLFALLAGHLFPGDPLDMVAQPFLWPGADPAYPLGTDSLGRDVLAGIVHGARVSLLVGLAAAALSLVIGTVVGALAGYFGGLADALLTRLVELVQTVPGFLLVIVIVAIAGPSVSTIALAIGLASWPTVARLVRAEFRTLREADFVLAARSLGYRSRRIIFAEILPNALPPVIVTISVMVASAILIESALSFLGMGDPNVVSWGSMIGAGREVLRSAWYLTALPGGAIIVAVLSLNLVGDALNDALNPRLRQA